MRVHLSGLEFQALSPSRFRSSTWPEIEIEFNSFEWVLKAGERHRVPFASRDKAASYLNNIVNMATVFSRIQ